jgi:hypothetical protein
MPGKGKRKGKHPQSKKSKAIIRHINPAAAAEAPKASPAAPAPAAQATAAPAAPRPAAQRPARPASGKAPADMRATVARYPHFVPELKRIGILAAIIVVILIVLSVALT